MAVAPKPRWWSYLFRALRYVLILSGVVLWVIGAIYWVLDASPLDGFDVRAGLSWTRVRTGDEMRPHPPKSIGSMP